MMKSAALAAIFPVVALFGAATLAQNGQVAARQRSEWITFNPVTRLTAESFAHPPAGDRPWVRMNMPATADPAEIATEIRELPDHGIAGVEVGQGAFPNNEQLVALFRAANQVGIQVSLSHGPTQSPAGYSIDDDRRKTLVVGKAVVNAGETFDGPVPPPGGTRAAHALRHGDGLEQDDEVRCTDADNSPMPNSQVVENRRIRSSWELGVGCP